MSAQLKWIGQDPNQQSYVLELKINDPKLLGQTLSLNVFVKAKPLLIPPPRRDHVVFGLQLLKNTPLSEGGNVYTSQFESMEKELHLSLPVKLLAKARPYQGHALQLETELDIKYQDQILTTLKIEPSWLGSKALNTFSFDKPVQKSTIDSPPVNTDVFSKELEMEPIVPAEDSASSVPSEKQQKYNKIIAFALFVMILIVIFVFAKGGFNMVQSPSISWFEVLGALGFLGTIGTLVALTPRMKRDGTEDIPRLNLKISATGRKMINAQNPVKLSELFEACAEIPLEQLRIRLIAIQEERFLYQVLVKPRGGSFGYNPYDASSPVKYAPSISNTALLPDAHIDANLVRQTRDGRKLYYDYQYKHICSQLLLYDKVMAHIPAGSPIQAACQDVLNLDTFFEQMLPPSILNDYCGLHLVWHLQLILPGYSPLDMRLSDLRFDPVDLMRNIDAQIPQATE